jgi:gluconokinase
MASGRPLDDEDRWPWLRAVGRRIASTRRTSADVVVACSALARRYRECLLRESGGPLVFIYPQADAEELASRLAARTGHFMPASLLASQIAAFEPPGPDEDAIVLPPHLGLDALVELCVQAASERSRHRPMA